MKAAKNIIHKLGIQLNKLLTPLIAKKINNTHRTRVIIICEDKVLLVKDWLGDGLWDFPGGGLKGNETLDEAAVREVREEVGIILSPKELVNLGTFEVKKDQVLFKIDLFAEAVSSMHIKKRLIEISEAEWFPLSKLPSDRANHVEESVQQWRNR